MAVNNMVFNDKKDTLQSNVLSDSSTAEKPAPKIVRLITDDSVKKTIQFDEISVPNENFVGENDAGGNNRANEYGLTFPTIRINDVVLMKPNIARMILSCKGNIPTIDLSLTFAESRFMNKNMPKDGDILSLFIRTTTAALQYIRCDFLITSCNATSNGYNISISGVLFIPNLSSAAETEAYTGTTKTVFKNVARKLGIGFAFNDFDDTDDYQTWIRCRESLPAFLNSTISHAWKDETSFFDWWIDLYYNLCFVNVNKFLSSTENEEDFDVTFATSNMNTYYLFDNTEDTSIANAKVMPKILTNFGQVRCSPFFIEHWEPTNNSTKISFGVGYSTQTYSFRHNQSLVDAGGADCFESLNNVPTYDTNKTSSHIILRGRTKYDPNKNPSSEQARVNYDFVNTYNNVEWTGVEYVMADEDKGTDSTKWSGNVHKNYNRAPYHNGQNVAELDKMYIEVTCIGLNLQVMRGERVPVYIIMNTMDNEMTYNKDDQQYSANRFYSGYYIVDSVEYIYDPLMDNSYSQYQTKFVLKRREWPTPE